MFTDCLFCEKIVKKEKEIGFISLFSFFLWVGTVGEFDGRLSLFSGRVCLWI